MIVFKQVILKILIIVPAIDAFIGSNKSKGKYNINSLLKLHKYDIIS